MNIAQFIDKWSRADGTERQTAQEHFSDLCRVFGEPTPNEAANPDSYSFEKGASKIDGSPGFADVWKRGHFGREYKRDRANLDRAYQQLQLYSVALENPPLLVVSDTKRFRIYTNWTNTVQTKHEFVLEDLAQTAKRELLENVFKHPDRLKPDRTREQVTKDAAKEFTTIAERLRSAGHAPEQVAHFLNRLVFCLFAEDVNLLQDDLFKRMLDNLAKRRDKVAAQSQKMFSELFGEMRGGGNYGLEHILHFNGGLFDDDIALPLDADSLDILRVIAKHDWSAIDPSIFGTLFERFLDPDKRAQIGAHYTDPDKIMMIVDPVIVRPLTAEWEAVKAELADTLSKARNKDGSPGRASINRAEIRLDTFMKRLDDVRILDPACGSGNFLYLALQSLKDIEYRAIVEAEAMGLARRVVHCGPQNVKGIEINQYAAELARTSIWIGNIQWLRRNGFEARKEPVLDNLDAIECRDALVTRVEAQVQLKAQAPQRTQSSPPGLTRGSMSSDGATKIDVDGRVKPGHDDRESGFVEAEWPEAEFIIGNPPFLGGNAMLRALGPMATTIREIYSDRVPPKADFVCHWFVKARAALLENRARALGLVATTSIKVGSGRKCSLDPLNDQELRIFEAWSNMEWTIEGASVRVSIICAASQLFSTDLRLDGTQVEFIPSNLGGAHGSGTFDPDRSIPLRESFELGFDGYYPIGEFYVSGDVAREWLKAPINPNGRPNSDVLLPHWNGENLVNRWPDRWIVDFGQNLSLENAALYEIPFSWVKEHVYPTRSNNNRRSRRETWWRFGEASPGLRAGLKKIARYIATPKVSRHRIFAWLDRSISPNAKIVAIMRDDDVTFGVLSSSFHRAWAFAHSSRHGVGDDLTYNTTRTFETFPFPEGLTPNIPASAYVDDPRAIAIATTAKRLDELRNAWLNPPDLVDIVPEVVPGYPDRILPKNEEAAAILRKRTLTNLYNARPQWLADAHRDLDAAVAAAYGWPADISEEDALAKLLELNLSRAGAGAAPVSVAVDEDDPEGPPNKRARLTRDEFAKISEVEGLRLSDDMKKAFADFDQRKLTAEERRQEIIDRFKRVSQ